MEEQQDFPKRENQDNEEKRAILDESDELNQNTDEAVSKDTLEEESSAKPSALNAKSQKLLAIAKKLSKRWFIDAFSGMAMGLFVTLIAGTILAQIGVWIGDNGFGRLVVGVANIAKTLMGAGIGVGIAHALKANKLVMFSAAVTGLAGAFADKLIAGNLTIALGAPGNPIGAYVVALITIEIAMLIAGKTKIDIIVVPLSMMILTLGAVYCAWPFIELVSLIGKGIAIATDATPFVMGIVIAVSMGILLTLPTSSAAIWVSIATPIMGGAAALSVTSMEYSAMALAGGAATVGCACHMIGFAVASFRENKWGGLVAQGIGTSMLQIPNLMKKPRIMLPEIIASAILGPLSTCVFQLKCTIAGGGMGTSGLVGVFGIIEESQRSGLAAWKIGLGIALLMFILPAAISLGVSELMRYKKWLKLGDQKLEL